MNIVKIQCPNCAGNIELDKDHEFGFCIYCGTKIYIPNAIQRIKGTVDIDKSIDFKSHNTLGNRAIGIQDYNEALKHYDIALEIKPNDINAIVGKALCCVALSTIQSYNFKYLTEIGLKAVNSYLSEHPESIDRSMSYLILQYTKAISFSLKQNFSYTSASNVDESNSYKSEVVMSSKLILDLIDNYPLTDILLNSYFSYCSTLIKLYHDYLNQYTAIKDFYDAIDKLTVERKNRAEAAVKDYWETNAEEYNHLLAKHRKLAARLEKTSVFDFKTKSMLKSQLSAIENQIKHPKLDK